MRIGITAHVRGGSYPLASALLANATEGFLMPHTRANQPGHAQTPKPDFRITYHGTVTTITPLSEACREWVEENVEIEPWQRFGQSIAVEPRYLEQLATAMVEEGLVLAADPSEKVRGGRRASIAMKEAILVISVALALSGCGLAKHYQNDQAKAELSAQITADGNRCRAGDQNACRLYQMEIQRCSILSTDPICQNW
jgi:hypothetical protein